MKKIRILTVFSVIFLVVLLTPVQAQMILKETEISRFVPLPWNVKVVPPDSSLRPEIAALSGRWEDKWDNSQEAMLIFEKVFEEYANVVYAWGKSGFQKEDYNRIKVKIIAGEKTKVKFSGTNNDFTFTLEDPQTLSGICNRRSAGITLRITMKKIE